eukprot:GEMP01095938.1.p1 GENE.GEMP01095938.1~~GEMP01095938.1.p1  ORF type:complete len:143 (+),score=36.29 GEMP01095938.1:51-479(+)
MMARWFFVPLACVGASQQYPNGASGLRCSLCKVLVDSAAQDWAKMIDATPRDSAYHYIGREKAEEKSVKELLPKLRKQMCSRGNLQRIPNPKGYSIHMPTLVFDCEDLIDNVGEDLMDALSMHEDVTTFCRDQDACRRTDEL